MIIELHSDASETDLTCVEQAVRQAGLRPHTILGPPRTAICAIGGGAGRDRLLELIQHRAVASVVPFAHPFPRASRQLQAQDTVVHVAGTPIGGRRIAFMAGPCTVETREQLLEVAGAVKSAGAALLRGGAFKPRSSPYSFQGLESYGLQLLEEARAASGLPVVTEVLEPGRVQQVAQRADLLQIGARNVQNFPLLRAVARAGKPVLLKRGLSTTIEEWLLSAEYLLDGGNPHVILCERGIRSFDPSTRFTLDLCAVPVLKRLTHLPVIVDPSHGTGRRDCIEPMSLAAVAAGADGLLIEVHGQPDRALCDGAQSLLPADFARLMERARAVAAAVDREI